MVKRNGNGKKKREKGVTEHFRCLYVLNRITNGTYADFFTTAVRTGGNGISGISFMLIERSMPGVKTRLMQCSGESSSGTAYITFEVCYWTCDT
jgi:alkylation response protein AidB-like acyl-CoA dehydrogenase